MKDVQLLYDPGPALALRTQTQSANYMDSKSNQIALISLTMAC